MKGDFTVLRFQPAKHYSGVRQQQGRVQTDADWNEQADVEAHRDRTTALDVVGPAGAPIDHAGFGLTCSGGDIGGAGCPAGSIRIGAGRYYVDGILCENEAEVPVNAQPDLPGVTFSGTAGSRYLAYLDVWEQHITVLEDESIREVALGGPDTATRLRTVWQVRLEGPVSSPCSAFATGWAPAGAATDGTMAARAQEAEQVTSDCLVPAGAGYRRLENQLYRVEVHDGGAALAFPRPAAVVADAVTVPDSSHVKVTNWVVGGVPWHTGQVVEVFSPATDAASTAGTLALVTAADQPNKTLTLDASLAGFQGVAGVKLRRVATFTWSRDNGSVVASLDAIDPLTSVLTVSHPNREMLSGFAPGQWVELSDRGRVLRGEPGMLVELAKVQGDKLTVVAWPGGAAPSLAADFGAQPTVRRWESKGATAVVAGGLLDLEGGVQVQFGAGTFRTGDYWTIPARSLTHAVGWPPDPADTSTPPKPASLPPEGIDHHYAPLALLDLQADGTTWKLASDCRNLFPPLTGLLSFTYLGGDGQEMAPDLTGASPAIPSALPEPLRVRVSNGRYPVKGAPVRFAVDANLGAVNGAKTVPVATDDHGVASCSWTLDPDPAHAVQHVAATLLDDTGQPMAGVPPIRFTANLSFAAEVAFDPRAEQCAVLDHAVTVQDAIDTLSMLTSLTYAGGDGQEARPGHGLPQLLRVLAGNGCGGVQGAKVQFLASGNGRVAATLTDLGSSTSASLDATTGADGIAACAWLLDPAGPSSQQLTATLDDSAGNPTTAPTAVVFTANLSVAAEVAYTPAPNCQLLAGTETVQQAIDVLCTQGGGKDPGIHVKAVLLRAASNAPLRNDSVIPPNALSEGILFNLDADVDPVVKGRPVVTVTLDLPFPVSDADRQTWGVPAPPAAPAFTVGTVPLTLRALVETGAKSLLWRLDPQIAPWFQGTLFKVLISRGVTDPVLAHLVAKGNFIWATGNELLNLDGEVFGTPGPGTIEVKLPSGDGRRGGDLEMWFRIQG